MKTWTPNDVPCMIVIGKLSWPIHRTLCCMVNGLAQKPKKGVANYDMLGVGACSLWTRDSLIGRPSFRAIRVSEGLRGELKHLSSRRKRKQCDSLSTGDGKGNRTNRILPEMDRRCGVWTWAPLSCFVRSELENSTQKGDSPVEDITESSYQVSGVMSVGYPAWIRGSVTPNSKYNLRPIAY